MFHEDPPNYEATTANTDVLLVAMAWLKEWSVPSQYRPFWQLVTIDLVPDLHVVFEGHWIKVPAAVVTETKWLRIDPVWANPGVLAHEMAHISYAQLTDAQKQQFSVKFALARQSDPQLKALWNEREYIKSNDVEGHADTYRFLGQGMPWELSPFYPNLL